MTRNLPRPALFAVAGALAIVAISGGTLMLRRRKAKLDDSIEPRRMPGSARDIHVSGGPPAAER